MNLKGFLSFRVAGAIIGSAGFILAAYQGMGTVPTALIGIGVVLITAGFEYGG